MYRINTELRRLVSLAVSGQFARLGYELFVSKQPPSFIKLFRYGFVAAAAFSVDFGAFVIFTYGFKMHYLLANGISFSFGIVTNYLLSKRWVFHESKFSRRKEIAGTLLVGVLGLIFNSVIIFICTSWLHIIPVISKLIATAIVFFWNFLARHYILHPSSLSRANQG